MPRDLGEAVDNVPRQARHGDEVGGRGAAARGGRRGGGLAEALGDAGELGGAVVQVGAGAREGAGAGARAVGGRGARGGGRVEDAGARGVEGEGGLVGLEVGEPEAVACAYAAVMAPWRPR